MFLKLLVLRLVEKGPLTGYQIIKKVKDIVGRASPGSIYPIIKYWEERNVIRRGVNGFELTEEGVRILKEIEAKRLELVSEVKKYLRMLAQILNDPEIKKEAELIPLSDVIGRERALLIFGSLEKALRHNKVEELMALLKRFMSEHILE